MSAATQHAAIWVIAALATAGVILRPWKVPEAVWTTLAVVALVVAGLLPYADALGAIARGTDVYLFLAGMMLLAELARSEGVFDHMATRAVWLARGSARRLFTLVFGIGAVVTIFMSNDATAVVLTPAIYAVARKAGAKPLPYLFACALIANAASFVLPISNPANLVVFGSHPPPLVDWLRRFALPSLVSIVATFIVLRLIHRAPLSGTVDRGASPTPLSSSGRIVAWGIACAAVVLLVASSLSLQLGLLTLVGATLIAAAVALDRKRSPWSAFRHVSWRILVLVAGLFVLVRAVETTGVVAVLADALRGGAVRSPSGTALGAGAIVAVACNLLNNLPTGLLAGGVLVVSGADPLTQGAVMIGVDLGPMLSVTGSLSTMLWLIAIRREGEDVGAWEFLKVGLVAMPVTLGLALLALLV